jgi:hypothetical protein
MTMKKLAIVSAIAMMSMGSVYAQQTTVTTTNENTAAETGGLMTTLSNSLGDLFNAGRAQTILDTFDPGTGDLTTRLTTITATNPVDITALAGAVNLSAINAGINITGTNVSLSGVTGALTGLSTTVIGAMNSSTLDIAKSITTLSDMTNSVLNIGGLANQGAGPTITTQSFGPGSLGLDTLGSTILESADATTQFNLTNLVSGTDTLATSVVDKLQTMNVFNMAVNMAPLVAGVNIAATLNPDSWFLGPQTGVVNLSGLQTATTAIGAMNSSITRLGAKLSN